MASPWRWHWLTWRAQSNWKTLHAEKEVPLDTSVPFASKVDAILTGTGYSDQRAAQMDITDLLELLSAFHDALIHFS